MCVLVRGGSNEYQVNMIEYHYFSSETTGIIFTAVKSEYCAKSLTGIFTLAPQTVRYKT